MEVLYKGRSLNHLCTFDVRLKPAHTEVEVIYPYTANPNVSTTGVVWCTDLSLTSGTRNPGVLGPFAPMGGDWRPF